MNTKRAISADIASTARVQNQIDQVISIYERELRRKDISEEQRKIYLDRLVQLSESTAYANEASREFQREQLEHSHKLPLKIILAGLLAIGGIMVKMAI